MRESETFGAEKGKGEELIQWMNNEAKKNKSKFEARLYDYEVKTENFGSFEMFSWMGDVKVARNLITKASKKFKVKVIEGSTFPQGDHVCQRLKSETSDLTVATLAFICMFLFTL